MEHELLSRSSDSWTDAQQPNPCTPTVIQGFAEHVCLPTDDPIVGGCLWLLGVVRL